MLSGWDHINESSRNAGTFTGSPLIFRVNQKVGTDSTIEKPDETGMNPSYTAEHGSAELISKPVW